MHHLTAILAEVKTLWGPTEILLKVSDHHGEESPPQLHHPVGFELLADGLSDLLAAAFGLSGDLLLPCLAPVRHSPLNEG